MTTGGYAERQMEIVVRDRARFGAGAIGHLPSAIRELSKRMV